MTGLRIKHLHDSRYSTPMLDPVTVRKSVAANGKDFLMVGSATEKALAHMKAHYPNEKDPLVEFITSATEEIATICREHLSQPDLPDFTMITTLLEFEPEVHEAKHAKMFRINVVIIMEFQEEGLVTFFCFVHPDEVETFELEHTPYGQNEKLH